MWNIDLLFAAVSTHGENILMSRPYPLSIGFCLCTRVDRWAPNILRAESDTHLLRILCLLRIWLSGTVLRDAAHIPHVLCPGSRSVENNEIFAKRLSIKKTGSFNPNSLFHWIIWNFVQHEAIWVELDEIWSSICKRALVSDNWMLLSSEINHFRWVLRFKVQGLNIHSYKNYSLNNFHSGRSRNETGLFSSKPK